MYQAMDNILFVFKVTFIFVVFWRTVNGFAPTPTTTVRCTRSTTSPSTVCPSSSSALSMGLFDGITKAFSNEEYGPPPEQVRATAKHILVQTEPEAQMIMKMIATGESSFEDCARDFSTCPSSQQGGSLGSFAPGTMVPEFDKVVFNEDTKIGQLMGPVLTDFGFHVIVVDKRTGGGDWY